MLRCNEDHTKKFSFPLGNGDVLLMKVPPDPDVVTCLY